MILDNIINDIVFRDVNLARKLKRLMAQIEKSSNRLGLRLNGTKPRLKPSVNF